MRPSLLLKTSESGTRSDSASLRATTMSSSSSQAAAIAHSFTKVLNQHKHSSKLRSATEVEDSVKKLRRLILVSVDGSHAVGFQHMLLGIEDTLRVFNVSFAVNGVGTHTSLHSLVLFDR